MWVIDFLVNFPTPYFETLARPSTLEVLWAMEHTPIPHFFVVFTLDPRLSLLKNWERINQL
jgi:hypothetical protein